ncbi:hypothetical protein HK103_003639 [Boothiomyces macroporosus]|uniref:CCDC43 PWI-like domain-containing protein n=1 Tax=Boothiomyces macroporosus TaxID=261099 RepID=A0AAD5UHK1_9FUNG|nr:hypothetical protein HK103_003639 [Boothiomyces macroporosus]
MTQNFDELFNNVSQYLASIDITDETFAEYILQIVQDEGMPVEEQEEIITEFLQEITEIEIKQWVKEIIQLAQDIRTKNEEEKKILELEKLQIQKELEPVVEQRQSRFQPKQLSKEEKLARDRILSQYAYEFEEIVEGADGETEIVFKEKGKQKYIDDSLMNNNVELVKEKERLKKLQHQEQHQKEMARNKANLEKQRLEKEEKKKGTQKREKRRG